MNHPVSSDAAPNGSRVGKLLQSGILLSSINLLAGFGNYVFQIIVSRNLGNNGEYGLANSALSFVLLLSLPVTIATFAVTHYIARFNFAGDDARLYNLLAGCRKFLFRLTIVGSLLALVMIKPLSHFFHFPRATLMLAALGCVWTGLWAAFGTALCQGLAWFKRLALIAILTMILRLGFGGIITLKFPDAEFVILATAVGAFANLILFFWKKDLSRPSQHPESPWNREFIQFLIVSAACVGGSYFFMQGDLLVAKRYFSATNLDAYSAAGMLARALPLTVGPMLTVLFTHRSGEQDEHSIAGHLKLLGLYAMGLVFGAGALFILRNFLLKLMARNTPEACNMITPFIIAMVFVGLLQALALWSLASRWLKTSFLYGILGLVYWCLLLGLGRSPETLLPAMAITTGAAFVILLIFWLTSMRRQRDKVPT